MEDEGDAVVVYVRYGTVPYSMDGGGVSSQPVSFRLSSRFPSLSRLRLLCIRVPSIQQMGAFDSGLQVDSAANAADTLPSSPTAAHTPLFSIIRCER